MNKLYLNTKDDLVASLGCKKVTNCGKLFVVSGAKKLKKAGQVSEFVYQHNQITSNVAFFSLLILSRGIFVGEECFAKKLKVAFGGEIKMTQYGHTAECQWICPKGRLTSKEVEKNVLEKL